jgi:rhamnosyltransferase
MDQPLPESAVCAVLVSYHPDVAAVAAAVGRLRACQVDVVVVDNGSGADTVGALREVVEPAGGVVIALPDNMGVAAAQNAGIRHAATQAADFVLLLDQDSLPAEDMVLQLLRAECDLTAQGHRVGAIGPVTIDSRTGAQASFVRFAGIRIGRHRCESTTSTVAVDFLIASGMLIALPVLRHVGGMSEDLFIDHVDTEWCIRARNLGYGLFGACAARLDHTLGDRVVRIWFGRWREVAVHSPARHYYVFRNTLLMLHRTPMPLAWRVAQLLRLLQFFVFFIAVGAPRRERLRYMLRGIVDGLRNRGGQYCV